MELTEADDTAVTFRSVTAALPPPWLIPTAAPAAPELQQTLLRIVTVPASWQVKLKLVGLNVCTRTSSIVTLALELVTRPLKFPLCSISR